MPARRTEDLRERVLFELMRLTATRGLGGVSIQDVADACNTTKQVVLYHFSSRDALLAAMISQMVDEANRALLSLLRTGTAEGPSRVEVLLARTQQILVEDPLSAAVAVRVLLDGEPELKQRLLEGLRPWRQFLVDQLVQAQREGQVRADLDVEAGVWGIGVLVASAASLLPLHDAPNEAEDRWRARRVEEILRSVSRVLVG